MGEKKVLLVGSEEFLLNKLKEYFEGKDYVVKIANYTEDAVKETEEWKPELIFMQGLVDSSGLDLESLLKQLVEKQAASYAMMIVFTPKGQDIDSTKDLTRYSEVIIYEESKDLIGSVEQFLKKGSGGASGDGEGKKKILVVDDSELQRKFIMSIIQEAGYLNDCVEASDGDEAIEVLGRNYREIGLILCDWNMPKLSGIDFIEAVAKIPPLSKIPLVMVTARTSDEDEQKARQSHPNLAGYLEKPFTPKRFSNTVGPYMPAGE